MTILEDRLAFIKSLHLKKGGHSPDSGEMCVMEAVAYVTGEPWSDHPECASEVIGAFLRTWNDDLDDEGREKLKPYIARLVGSKGSKAVENKRAWLAADWLIHQQAPAWLDLAGCHEQATALRELPPILTAALAKKHQPKLDEVRSQASAAWSAARSAAESAARSAAESAARSAAESAAWSAAESAAYAKKDLQPTVVSLQRSALELLDAMLEVR